MGVIAKVFIDGIIQNNRAINIGSKKNPLPIESDES